MLGDIIQPIILDEVTKQSHEPMWNGDSERAGRERSRGRTRSMKGKSANEIEEKRLKLRSVGRWDECRGRGHSVC